MHVAASVCFQRCFRVCVFLSAVNCLNTRRPALAAPPRNTVLTIPCTWLLSNFSQIVSCQMRCSLRGKCYAQRVQAISQYLRFLVPKTSLSMGLGIKNLKFCVTGPSEIHCFPSGQARESAVAAVACSEDVGARCLSLVGAQR